MKKTSKVKIKGASKRMASRYKGNLAIASEILEAVNTSPTLRFGQILWNLNILRFEEAGPDRILDPYYEEPSEILKRIKKAKAK